ncbi:energy transducer TonB [Hyalangium gracile]|uniref:energy transducer TonB n=1 Tax=Hyalangium gracile TaxID=394092 RepID=UPI001CC9F842|nr:energy transducer TonB [Hyalangium gracile]
MGEAAAGAGEWERWGSALLVAAFIHVGAIVLGLSVPQAAPKAPPPPAEPELVMLTFMAPKAAAPQAAVAPAAVPERVQPKARARPPRPLVAPREIPAPLSEKAPEPQQAVQDTPEPPADDEVAEAAPGPELVTGLVAGVVSSAVSTPGGSTLGVSGGEAVDVKLVARPPTVLEQVQPQYPRAARKRGIEGLVLVRVIIGANGRVEPEHTRVIRSVPALDAAAVSAVSQWRFTPALGRQGRPVRVIIEVPVQFSLK